MRALFLTWDGPQQSYLESLFLPIFHGLKAHGVEVEVLQLTWAKGAALEPVRAAAQRSGIGYVSVHIPSSLRKLALPAVVAYGAARATLQMRHSEITTLFPRSLIPMSMSLLLTKAAPQLDLVFDADGFMADERIDFGGWTTTGASYRALRAVEAGGVQHSRAVICRTQRAKQLLVERAGGATQASPSKIFVAPNGKDSTVFCTQDVVARRATRARHGIDQAAPWLVYVGSLGPQYYPELMVDTFQEVRRRLPRARFSCFTFQTDALKTLLRRRGLPTDFVSTDQLLPAEIPNVLAACDLGLGLRRESSSQRGVSPIKISEYLLCGAPVVATRVGDLDAQLSENNAALLVDAESSEAASSIAEWFARKVLPEREQCRADARQLGLRWFGLDACVSTYASALLYGRGSP